MGELSQDQLRQLCAALGWQGGTFWQVLEEVTRLKCTAGNAKPQMGLATLANVIDCLHSEGRYVDEEGEATDRLQDLHDALVAGESQPEKGQTRG